MRGAWRLVLGLGVGLFLAFALIAVPPLVQGTGYYEIIDSIVYMGIPLVAVSVLASWLWWSESSGRDRRD